MNEIEKFIRDEIQPFKDSFEKANVEDICRKVVDKFKIPCTFKYIGGFESPGYDINCYAIVFLDEQGEINIIEYNYEFY